jgi:dihydropteroate synthase
VKTAADLVIPASNQSALSEIASWDGFRPATFPPAEFPVDVVRLSGSTPPPLMVSRARRSESLKALPSSLRSRAEAAFARAGRRPASLSLAHGRRLDLSEGPVVMGVINVTPDSFSDGGLYFDSGHAIEGALSMLEAGAAIVDVGGESTRPSSYGVAQGVDAAEEIARVVPVVAGVRARSQAPISVDTRKAEVARRALEAGADLINDVTAGRFDSSMAESIAAAGAGAILMHMKGTDPRTMQDDVHYVHPIAEVAELLATAVERLLSAGVPPEAVAIDPGLGFGKSPEGSLLLLRHLSAFHSLGLPVAVGASRKAFVRRFSGIPNDAVASMRLPGSLAAAAAAADAGAALVRAHDVAETVRFLRMLRAIRVPGSVSSQPTAVAVR